MTRGSDTSFAKLVQPAKKQIKVAKVCATFFEFSRVTRAWLRDIWDFSV